MSFKQLNARNKAEIEHLQKKIRNNTKLGKLLSGQNRWANLGPANYRHMRYLESQPRVNKAATNKRLGELVNSITSRRIMYGYVIVRNAHRNKPWVPRTYMRNGKLLTYGAPASMPNWEVPLFRDPSRHGLPWHAGTMVQTHSKHGRAIANNKRAKLVAEGSMRPIVYGPTRKPSPPRPKFVHNTGPSLKKLAWNASGMETLTPAQRTGIMRAMGYTRMTLENLRPKTPPRLSPTALTKIRRNAAAKTIQHAVRRHQRQVAR